MTELNITYAVPEITNPVDLLVWMNTITNGLFWHVMLLVIFGVAYFSISDEQTSKLNTSLFITALLGLLLRGMGLITDSWLISVWALLAVSLFWSYYHGRGR